MQTVNCFTKPYTRDAAPYILARATKLDNMKKYREAVNDYNDYERKHRKLAKGDTDSITDTVDQENTDIAAVARSIFPDHTEEGAQSQLRKILNHERPMTKDVASKIERMISRGRIAVK